MLRDQETIESSCREKGRIGGGDEGKKKKVGEEEKRKSRGEKIRMVNKG